MNLFLIAFVFAGFFEAAAAASSSFWFLLCAFAAIFFAGVSFWRSFASITLSLLALSWAALSAYFLFLSQSALFSQSVIALSAAALYGLARTFQAKNVSFGIALSFLIFLGSIFSLLRIYFLSNLSLSETVPLVFALTIFLFFISEKLALPTAELPLKIRLSVFSFGVGFLISELYIVFSAFPFTVFAIDFMLFIVYYTLWDMTMRYFSRAFTKRALANSLGWLIFAFIILLSSILLIHPFL